MLTYLSSKQGYLHLRRVLTSGALATGLALGALAAAAPARADIVRCVGAIDVPGAYACYTSPRFDHVGLGTTAVATVPVVCYGIGCTQPQLLVYVPDGDVNGRFTAVMYLGHSYTVYRPTGAQPYVITSDNPLLTPADESEVLVISAALDAAGQ